MGSLQFPNMGMGLRLAAFGRRSSAINVSYSGENGMLNDNEINLSPVTNAE